MADRVTVAELLEGLDIALVAAFAGTDWIVLEEGPPDAATPPAVWAELERGIKGQSRSLIAEARIVAALALQAAAPSRARELEALERIVPIVNDLSGSWSWLIDRVEIGGIPHSALIVQCPMSYPDC